MDTSIQYSFRIDGKRFDSDDSSISGEELLALAGRQPAIDYIIYLLLEDGDMELIRPSETVDLQRAGIEKFRTFESDAIFRLQIDNEARQWGCDWITGRALKKLSGCKRPNEFGVWQQFEDGSERLVGNCDIVDLTNDGIERFRLGSRFSVCIEGVVYEWPRSTITTEEIIALGGWDASQGAVEVDKDQNERALGPGEEITLKPGHNFCKRQSFKRGFDENSRLSKELLLLRQGYPNVEYRENGSLCWFRVDGYHLPSPLSPEQVSVTFSVTAAHPVPKPYGFYVPAGLKHGDRSLTLTNPKHPPPFEGVWRFASWDPVNWRPGPDVSRGDNLWGWARSFRQRLLEGE